MERLWTRSFVFMTIGTFSLFTAFYMLYPTLPLFIIEIGGTEAHAGLAMGIFMLSAVLLRPFVGGLLDRFGRRSFIIWGVILFAIAMYSYEWVGGILALIILRVIHGLSWGVSTTALLTSITDLIPQNRRGEGLGWSGMAMTLAMGVGPMIGIWITQDQSYHLLFLFGAILSIIALLLTFGAKMPLKRKPETTKIILFEKKIVPVTIATFLVFVSYGGITTFVPLYASVLNFNSGTFFLIYAVTLILVRPLAGKFADKYGEAFVIIPALFITIFSLIVLGFSNSWIGVIISAVLYGIGFGSAQPALQAATIHLVSSERTGVANASFATATDLGIGVGAMILGWVSQYTNYQTLFNVSALSVVLSLLVFFFLVKRLLKKQKKSEAA
ncbi:MFS transporter [Priestia endophytica]|uniref:MFS transporter n=1 Tax=Priestia endophytica TaxID=135735 RepID=A0AAX1QA51_9BACI|nr:MFS transporter [Priestia endophytica]RAS77247.1 MFS transporter [Priestia endophytica]